MIYLRCDGGFERGLGHLFRMRTLATALLRKGKEVSLVCRENAVVAGLLAQFGIAHVLAPAKLAEPDIVALACTVGGDAELWVFDVLDTDAAWIDAARRASGSEHTPCRVVTFDDLGPGASHADAIINALRPPPSPWPNCVSGLDYVMIDPRIRSRRRARAFKGPAQSVGITLGGADTWGVTPRIICALAAAGFTGQVIACLGPSFAHERELERSLAAGAQSFHISVERAAADLHAIVDTCDAVIANGSQTLIELLAMGMPALAVANETHEVGVIDTFLARGALERLGFRNSLALDCVANRLRCTLDSPTRLTALSERALAAVDGLGLEAVLKIVEDD